MHYYGTRLSENISRREPEGYLLCLNVPVARTGTQDYLPEELGLPRGPDFIAVLRPEEEVFAPETMASFEGMPVTNDHPAEGVDIENIRRLQTGHAHNVRRGTGEESDLLLADLMITDERLIDAILSGKREISCGYTYELSEENGQYIQRKIRGNHIAVVDAGRAGPRVSIKDHKRPERRNSMKKSLSRILARMAKDGDIETVAEIIEEMMEPETVAEEVAEEVAEAVAEAAPAAAEEPAAVVETPEATVVVDEATLGEVLARLDQIISLLSPAAADEDPVEEIAEAVEEAVEAVAAEESGMEGLAAEEEVAEILETILEPEVSTTLEETEGDEDPADPEKTCSQDALRAALTAVRPALSRMNRKQRRKVCADIAARLKSQRKGSDSGYAALYGAARGRTGNPMDLGKRIMASRNPNYHK